MIRKISKLYGFSKPYDFPKALAFILAILGLLMVVPAGIYDLFQHDFAWNKHIQFYTYLIGLYLLSAVFAFRPKFAFAVLTLAVFETALSLGLSGFGKITNKIVIDLRPRIESKHRFVYHPLLVGIPKPNYFQEKPLLKHDAKGRREVIWADKFSEDAPSVNVYGGSTTYDVAVANGYTWVDNLQKLFGDKLRFYNYGVQGYSTVENIVQTAFYARHGDKPPVCSIYYLGWNDIRNLHIPNLDPGYANFHMLGQFDNLSLRNLRPTVSPLYNMLIAYILSTYETMVIPPRYFPDSINTDGVDPELERIFTRNLETIIALNKMHGTKPFFVGQILNRDKLRGNGVYGWLPKVRDKDVWKVQKHYNKLMQQTVERLGAKYIEVPIDSFVPTDFADEGHFSPAGSLKFSAFIADGIRDCENLAQAEKAEKTKQ